VLDRAFTVAPLAAPHPRDLDRAARGHRDSHEIRAYARQVLTDAAIYVTVEGAARVVARVLVPRLEVEQVTRWFGPWAFHRPISAACE
jgi:hypothetical protein